MFHREERSSYERRRVSQAEIQDAVLRLQGRVSERLSEAFGPIATSTDARLRLRASRDHLLYQATALDVAIGPIPESNLLDLVSFAELALQACRTRWSVDVHGDDGARVIAALEAARDDAWRVVRGVLTSSEEDQLRRILRAWVAENPDLDRGAVIRLPEFAAVTGEGTSKAGVEARGLFASMRRGVAAADMARMLGERALFAAQRMPFLARLQAGVAAREILEEVRSELPARVEEIVDAVVERVELVARRVIVTGAVAGAAVVVVAAVAYRIVR